MYANDCTIYNIEPDGGKVKEYHCGNVKRLKKFNISKFRENWIFYSRYVIICNGQFSHNAGGGVYVQKAAYPRHACQYGFADSIG